MTIQSNQRAVASDILTEHNSDGTHKDLTTNTIDVSGTATIFNLVMTNWTLTTLNATNVNTTNINFALTPSSAPTLPYHIANKQYVDDQLTGVDEFTELTDTPANYVGSANYFVAVNAGANALVFVAGPTYAQVSAADPNTDITGIELEDLSDGGSTVLHTHPGMTTDQYVGVDAAATPNYLGATAIDGVLRAGASINYADGGDFVTLSVNDAAVDHDSLLNYDPNDHVDHTGVTLTAGAGLTGGGTIAANRTFDVGAGTGITVNANDVECSADYSVISANDAATNITAAELEQLTDLSNCDGLHTHVGVGTDQNVAIDALATPGFIGDTSANGVLRTDATLNYVDGGDFVTLGVAGGGGQQFSMMLMGG